MSASSSLVSGVVMFIHRFVIDNLRWDLDGSSSRRVVNEVGYLGATVPYFDTLRGLADEQIAWLDELSLRASDVPLARSFNFDSMLEATTMLASCGVTFSVRGCQLINYEVGEGWKVPENAVLWR